jgi:uncharacterized small protein (DUF1192 family)
MSNDKINSQIALLQEQIYNLEQSGHFTEKEMDSKTVTFRTEIETLKAQLLPLETVLGVSLDELDYITATLKFCISKNKAKAYGLTTESYNEGYSNHSHYFSQMTSPALLNTWTTLGLNQINRG